MEELVRELAGRVIRMFYEPKYVVAFDFIQRLGCLNDEELAEKLHCQLKEAQRIIAVLRDNRLVRVESRTHSVQPKPNNSNLDQKTKLINRVYAYVDNRLLCKAVKWRLERMRERSESRLRADEVKRGFKCQVCGKRWTCLDAQLLEISTDGFMCDNCQVAILEDEDSSDDSSAASSTLKNGNKKSPQQLHLDLMECIQPLIVLLKKIDIDKLPVNVRLNDLLKQRADKMAVKEKEQESTGKELKIAGSSPSLTNSSAIVVELDFDLDGDDNKKESTELPIWHTDQGDKVVLESKEVEEDTPQGKKPRLDSFDDIGTTPLQQVSVRGVKKALEEVTEEDKRQMTSEEYKAYFEAFLDQQGS